MENTKYFNQEIMKQTSQLIFNCQEALKSTLSFLQPSKTKKLQSNIIKEEFQQPPNSNTQEKEDIEKQLQILRKKAKKSQCNASIKQTDLGENQYTFTVAELKKLEMIDEFIERGLQIPDLDKLSINQPQPQKSQAYIPTVQSDYNKELQTFQKWGSEGNTRAIMNSIQEEDQEKVNKLLPQTKDSNIQKHLRRQKSKFSKTINFQKHTSKFQSKSQFQKRSSLKISGFMERNRPSNASAFNRISPNILSQFSTKNYLSRVERKKFPAISNSEAKLDQKKLKSLNNKERLNKLGLDLYEKYAKYDKTTYMTQKRAQGIYECEMIRKAKVLLSHKDYLNLEMDFGGEESDKENEDHPKQFKRTQTLENSNSIHENIHQQNKRQIDTILSLNKKRLKMERQRVITKLKC